MKRAAAVRGPAEDEKENGRSESDVMNKEPLPKKKDTAAEVTTLASVDMHQPPTAANSFARSNGVASKQDKSSSNFREIESSEFSEAAKKFITNSRPSTHFAEKEVLQILENPPKARSVAVEEGIQGLFTNQNIPHGAYITEICGAVSVHSEWFNRDIFSGQRENDRAFLFEKELLIDVSKMGNVARYARRSCKPNAELKLIENFPYLHVMIKAKDGVELKAMQEVSIKFEDDWMQHPRPAQGCTCEGDELKTCQIELFFNQSDVIAESKEPPAKKTAVEPAPSAEGAQLGQQLKQSSVEDELKKKVSDLEKELELCQLRALQQRAEDSAKVGELVNNLEEERQKSAGLHEKLAHFAEMEKKVKVLENDLKKAKKQVAELRKRDEMTVSKQEAERKRTMMLHDAWTTRTGELTTELEQERKISAELKKKLAQIDGQLMMQHQSIADTMATVDRLTPPETYSSMVARILPGKNLPPRPSNAASTQLKAVAALSKPSNGEGSGERKTNATENAAPAQKRRAEEESEKMPMHSTGGGKGEGKEK